MNNARNLKHLYARAGFGVRFEDLQDHENWSVNKAVRKLLRASEHSEPITVLTENIDLRPHPKDMPDDQKKQIQEDRNKQEKALNEAWLKQLGETEAQ